MSSQEATSVVRIAIIGINGFGSVHLKQTLALAVAGYVRLIAVSDLKISEELAAQLKENGTRLYSDYKEMLATEREADLVIVSTPIHLHARMGIDVMEAGYDLLLEKPPAALIDDVDRLIEVSERTGRRCAVNFSSLPLEARSQINEWLEQGKIGDVQAVKAIGLWQRTEGYYNRTPWAGKLSIGGQPVLDGTVMNPFAHTLHMVLQLATLPALSKGAQNEPTQVQAELYRANAIEGEDTSCIRVEMSGGPSAYFYATVCANNPVVKPRVMIEGTGGTITCDYTESVTLQNGEETLRYDNPEQWPMTSNLMNFIRVLRGEEQELRSPLAKARLYMQAANGAFESASPIVTVPEDYIARHLLKDDQLSICIEGIEAEMNKAFDSRKLLSETGVPWAKPSQPFRLAGYKTFSAAVR